MAFDKEDYWARRQAGERGQGGHYFSGRGAAAMDKNGRLIGAEVGNKPVSKKALLKNTKRARRAAERSVTHG